MASTPDIPGLVEDEVNDADVMDEVTVGTYSMASTQDIPGLVKDEVNDSDVMDEITNIRELPSVNTNPDLDLEIVEQQSSPPSSRKMGTYLMASTPDIPGLVEDEVNDSDVMDEITPQQRAGQSGNDFDNLTEQTYNESKIKICILPQNRNIPIASISREWGMKGLPNIIVRLIGSCADDKLVKRGFFFLTSLAKFLTSFNSWLLLQARDKRLFHQILDLLEMTGVDKRSLISVLQETPDKVNNILSAQTTQFKQDLDVRASLYSDHMNTCIKQYVIAASFPEISTDHFECILFYCGTLTDLHSISNYVGCSKPLIILKGSGGIADVLADCLDTSTTKSYWDILSAYIETDPREKGLHDIQSIKLYVSLVNTILQKVAKSFQVIDIGQAFDKTKLGQVFLSSFTGDKLLGQSGTDLNFRFLKLCLILNELEIAIIDGKLRNLARLHSLETKRKEFVKLALRLNNYKFIQYLVNQEPSNKTCLTEDVLSEALNENTELERVRERIKKMLNIETDEVVHKDLEFLFKETVLANCFELSQLLWQKVQAPTGAALYAYGCLSVMKSMETEENKRQEIATKMIDFETMACETLRRTYALKPEQAIQLLSVKMSKWGNMSCPILALKFGARRFLSESACLKFTYNTWTRGKPLETLRGEDDNECAYCQGTLRKSANIVSLECRKCQVREKFPPKLLLIFRFIGLTLFLLLYSALLISYLDAKTFHWLEFLLLAWIVTFFLEIINQLVRNKALGYSDLYLWIELVSVLLYVLAWIVRLVGYVYPETKEWIFSARILFSVDFVGFSVCLLEVCFTQRFLGPLLLTVFKMIKILIQFLIILMIICFAYAVASESIIYPNTNMSPKLYFFVFRKAFWAIFGEFSMEQLNPENGSCNADPNAYTDFGEVRCPDNSGKYFMFPLLGAYHIFVNILLLNLIIAKFNSIIESVEVMARQIWNQQFTQITLKYCKVIFPPGPFLVLCFILWICRTRDFNKPFEQELPVAVVVELTQTEDDVRYKYLQDRNAQLKNQVADVQCNGRIICLHKDRKQCTAETQTELNVKNNSLQTDDIYFSTTETQTSYHQDNETQTPVYKVTSTEVGTHQGTFNSKTQTEIIPTLKSGTQTETMTTSSVLTETDPPLIKQTQTLAAYNVRDKCLGRDASCSQETQADQCHFEDKEVQSSRITQSEHPTQTETLTKEQETMTMRNTLPKEAQTATIYLVEREVQTSINLTKKTQTEHKYFAVVKPPR
ncbi:transient receptor potential cation channel subfamily M member 2-like isoform X5 [Biomphalaria glabrata]|uniref:Transient receptor potential cation channel subfamily M member 2-like isoform X5 n=1 Tax=Biomphalaria glabrata TaxID=6526 RepID=A0A9W2YAY5_BIOGL|nr:transient receptor potential cation channel subfamily M member 2-like isoform X5 [Biomphalaria glabrata]